jgi:hypothetical protein
MHGISPLMPSPFKPSGSDESLDQDQVLKLINEEIGDYTFG